MPPPGPGPHPEGPLSLAPPPPGEAAGGEGGPWPVAPAAPLSARHTRPPKGSPGHPRFGPDTGLARTWLTSVRENRGAAGHTVRAPSCPRGRLLLQRAAVEAEARHHAPARPARRTRLLEALAAHRAHGARAAERGGLRAPREALPLPSHQPAPASWLFPPCCEPSASVLSPACLARREIGGGRSVLEV